MYITTLTAIVADRSSGWPVLRRVGRIRPRGEPNFPNRRHRWLNRWIRHYSLFPPPEALRAAGTSARESKPILAVTPGTHLDDPPCTGQGVDDRCPLAPWWKGSACIAVPENTHSRAEPNCSLFKDQTIRRNPRPACTGRKLAANGGGQSRSSRQGQSSVRRERFLWPAPQVQQG